MNDMERRLRLKSFVLFLYASSSRLATERLHSEGSVSLIPEVLVSQVEEALVSSGLCDEAELKIIKDLICHPNL